MDLGGASSKGNFLWWLFDIVRQGQNVPEVLWSQQHPRPE